MRRGGDVEIDRDEMATFFAEQLIFRSQDSRVFLAQTTFGIDAMPPPSFPPFYVPTPRGDVSE